jgi:hypothetical protein
MKILKRPKVKIILLAFIIIIIVSIAIIGGIAIHLYVGNLNIRFEQNLNKIAPEDMRIAEFIEDFEYMYNFFAANCPFFDINERRMNYNWLDLKEEYFERIEDCENTTEFLNVILDAITAIQNCHTYLVPPSYTETQRGYFVEDDRYPFYEIFSEEVVEANQYWIDIYNDVMYERDNTFLVENRINYNILMVYNKGEYIVHEVLNSTYNDFLGSKVVAVDTIPIHELIAEKYKVTYLDYDYARSRNYVGYLRPVYLDFSTIFTFENSTGSQFNATLFYDAFDYSSLNWRGYYPEISDVYTRLYPSDSVGYLQVGGMYNPTPFYHTKIMSFYNSIADYDNLIIDIRGNCGGNDGFWIEELVKPLLKQKAKSTSYFAIHDKATYSHIFRKEREWYWRSSKLRFDHLPPEVLTKEIKIYRDHRIEGPENAVEFDGKIALLVDNMIFSSSESFAVFCKNTGFATLYGTNTGGDGIGDATYFVLPNSKLIIRYSYLLGLFPNGDANQETHTPPDVYYESSRGNWSELIDFTIKDLTT